MGYMDAVRGSYSEPFLMPLQSNLILFGFRNGAFFENEYDSCEAYETALEQLEKKIAVEKKEEGDAPLYLDPLDPGMMA